MEIFRRDFDSPFDRFGIPPEFRRRVNIAQVAGKIAIIFPICMNNTISHYFLMI